MRMRKDYFHFLSYVQAVILGVLMITTSKTLAEASRASLLSGLASFQFAQLVIALMLFVESYIVMDRYHVKLKVPYYPFELFFDVFLFGLSFVVLARFIEESLYIKPFQRNPPLMFAGIFGLLFIRQLINVFFIKKKKNGKWILTTIFYRIYIPIWADIIGILFCFLAYFATLRERFLGQGIVFWSWTGLAMLFFYLFITRIGKIRYELRK